MVAVLIATKDFRMKGILSNEAGGIKSIRWHDPVCRVSPLAAVKSARGVPLFASCFSRAVHRGGMLMKGREASQGQPIWVSFSEF